MGKTKNIIIGVAALSIAGAIFGDDEEDTAVKATVTQPVSTITAPAPNSIPRSTAATFSSQSQTQSTERIVRKERTTTVVPRPVINEQTSTSTFSSEEEQGVFSRTLGTLQVVDDKANEETVEVQPLVSSAPRETKTASTKVVPQPLWISVSSGLNVRKGPGTSHGVLFVAKRGDRVTQVGTQGGWRKVRFNNGKEGWVSAKFVSTKLVRTTAPVSQFTKSTKPASSSRFDCSRKYCKQMRSCAEARYKLTQCGHRQLDRDRDGRPCENVC